MRTTYVPSSGGHWDSKDSVALPLGLSRGVEEPSTRLSFSCCRHLKSGALQRILGSVTTPPTTATTPTL
jgi:hypothetical protein